MRRVKGKDTAPEILVRRLLTRMGLRYRLHRADLPGKPDIVMPGRKLVIFVHGCYWHGHNCARGDRVPKANRPYWEAKIGRNRARDVEHRAALEALGWRVLTVWECGLRDEGEVLHVLHRAAGEGDPKGGGGMPTHPVNAPSVTS